MMHIISTTDADSCNNPLQFTDKILLFTDGQHLYAALLLYAQAGDSRFALLNDMNMNEQTKKKSGVLNDRVLLGVFIIGAAVLLLLRNLGFWFPSFLFTWPVILIVIGLFIGLKDGFRNNGWWIMVAIGGFFLLNRQFKEFELGDFFWPLLIFVIGLSLLLNKGKSRKKGSEPEILIIPEPIAAAANTSATLTDDGETVVDAAAIFGAVKKNIYSKNFKGGEVVTIFGGTEINLMYADFTGVAKLEIVNVFGGTTLIVPAHWQIKSEAAAVLGAIEDKRREPAAVQTDKVLMIEGFVLFGGIDIKSR